MPRIKGAITFDHVNFRYRIDGGIVLQDVSLEVLAGQVVGIVGPSGSGKSTLTKLVQRVYMPEGAEKRKPTYDLTAFKAAFAECKRLSVTGTALRTAAALGFGRAEIAATIQTMERRHFTSR